MTSWIAADWGTSNLRIWAMDEADEVIGHATSDDGMGRLAPGDFEGAFLKAAAPFLAEGRRTTVLICGMAGARTGWQEVGYVPVPAPPSGPPEPVATTDGRLDVHILPGLSQADPADVMRGEETQLAGLLATQPGFDGLVCLPGTHSKWARIAGGRVTTFRTAMTGEFFALLSTRSTLAGFAAEGWDEAAFAAAVREPQAEMLLADLFSLRARGLLQGLPPGAGRAHLSGLLIGAEVAGMSALAPDGRVSLLGEPTLCRLYETALTARGLACDTLEAEALTLAGLIAAHQTHFPPATG
ncbi:2-dehydro-3-deoxygalactonokinase [Pseudooceanicola sp.]|uniref:2-dehydro-3-deoxygalactonokinase n=1 Tax=Pseudooceanicola sp. TaxID=1914328 RepID=UPI0035C6890D